ncbi:MAG: tetratricopeptide repeat protein [Burkholderiales bacterium]
MPDPAVSTFLFTDIEGSTRLWEQEPARMHDALAHHDALARRLVAEHRGEFVKSTGDGVHAVFGDPLDGLAAAVAFLTALADPATTGGLPLLVRCGLHAGVDSRRDNDFYGNAVNRAARIMTSAHGGQILVSQTVEALVRARLPAPLSLRDLGTVRLRGLAQPERVFQVVHPALRESFPALRMLQETPHNLPQPLTSFVGREHELAEVKRQLANTRLLTLLGIGGLGKSRLSLAVAADVLDEYPDGVWFVELAPVTDPRLVPQTIATVLAVKEETGRPVLDALRDFVRDRTLLLVLDNCEHLVQACAEAARALLEAGSGVRILASSRERLNLRGEKAYSLAPLAVALPQQHLKPDAITQFPAVRLFVERATAANSAFAVTADNAAAIVDVCHRLDGIPLALELAAARVRAMSVEAIAERLSDRFRLLRGGDRTALPRQQTLRALIDWSYDLLSEPQQALFRRLSIFAGGFTLAAAEAVAAGTSVEPEDVLDLLTDLVEKSLVASDGAGDRFTMLETVRQYAAEKLDAAAEAAPVRERHLAYFQKFAEGARARIFGPEQGKWLALLDRERENLLVAHAACANGAIDAERGLALVSDTKAYWMQQGLVRLGHRLTREALARPGAQARTLARSKALFDLGQYEVVMGAAPDALAHLEESLAIAREIDNPRRIAASLQPLAMVHMTLGNLAVAREFADEALALARTVDNEREVLAALSNLGMVHRLEGRLEECRRLDLDALALARKLGDRASIAITQINLAMTALGLGATDDLVASLREARDIAGELGSRTLGQSVLEVIAGLAATRGDWERVARCFGAAEAIAEETGSERMAADAHFLQPHIDAARAALGAEAFARHEQAGRATPYDSAFAEACASVPLPP